MRTRSEKKLDKQMRILSRVKEKAQWGVWVDSNLGKEVKHKDRSYIIQRDGSYRRITEKCDIARNSLDYNKN